jgi:uncharacterized membrane protein
MNTWRYIQNGQKLGPIDITELQAMLKSGALSQDTLVCKEGTEHWASAHTFSELTGAPSSAGVPSKVEAPPVGLQSVSATSVPSDAEDIEKNKVYGVIAYIGILFLVPLLAAPQSKFARYHTNQGLVLFIAALIASAGAAVLGMVPFVGCIAVILMPAILVGGLVMMILGIVNAASGQYKPLPLIGNFEIIK